MAKIVKIIKTTKYFFIFFYEKLVDGVAHGRFLFFDGREKNYDHGIYAGDGSCCSYVPEVIKKERAGKNPRKYFVMCGEYRNFAADCSAFGKAQHNQALINKTKP